MSSTFAGRVVMDAKRNTGADVLGLRDLYPEAKKPVDAIESELLNLWRWRWAIRRLFLRDFLSRRRGSLLGIFWVYITPLVPMAAYIALRLVAGGGGGDMHPILFVTLGMFVWHLVTEPILNSTKVLRRYGAILSSTDLPAGAALLAGLGQVAFDSLVRLAIVVPIFLVFVRSPGWDALLCFLVLIPAMALSVAIAILVGLFSIAADDIERVVQLLLRYLVFLSGAIFPLHLDGTLFWLYAFNPIAVMLEAFRDLAVRGEISHPGLLFLYSFIAFGLFAWALLVSSRLEMHLKGILR